MNNCTEEENSLMTLFTFTLRAIDQGPAWDCCCFTCGKESNLAGNINGPRDKLVVTRKILAPPGNRVLVL